MARKGSRGIQDAKKTLGKIEYLAKQGRSPTAWKESMHRVRPGRQ